MSNYNECLNVLLVEAQTNGYLTFDKIMNCAEQYELSIVELDKLNEAINLRDIIIYETEPSDDDNLDELEDYSRVDYDAIFNEIVSLSNEMKYIIDIVRELPPPQYKEISDLVIQNFNGNSYARDRLILLHLRVVMKIALSMTKQYNLDITEAVSSGITGLIVATDKFDPYGFSAFQSYASLWVQQHIQRECNPIWFEFYFPAHFKTNMLKIYEDYNNKYNFQLCGFNKKDMIYFSEEMSEKYDLSADKIMLSLKMINIQMFNKYSMELVFEFIFKYNEWFDIEDKDIVSPEEYTNKELLRRNVVEVLNSLTEREEKVIQLRYGLDGGENRTLEEVGDIFNVTRERIRQIEAKALRKLRHPSRSKKLKDFLD